LLIRAEGIQLADVLAPGKLANRLSEDRLYDLDMITRKVLMQLTQKSGLIPIKPLHGASDGDLIGYDYDNDATPSTDDFQGSEIAYNGETLIIAFPKEFDVHPSRPSLHDKLAFYERIMVVCTDHLRLAGTVESTIFAEWHRITEMLTRNTTNVKI